MPRCLRFVCARVPQRWVFAVMGSLAFASAYSMRISLAMAITEMVAPKYSVSNHTETSDVCPSAPDDESTSLISRHNITFDWNESMQGIILSSFFWGLILTLVPGGILSQKVGGKYVLGLAILSSATFTLLTPIVVYTYDAPGIIVLRVLSGLGEGAMYPAINILTAQWAPPLERSKIGSTVLIGKHMGATLSTIFCGLLIQNSSIGWPMVFYVFGSLGILWSAAWIVLCYNHPSVHPFISEAEQKYLHETMKEHTHRHSPPTPWRHILTSIPFWAVMAGAVGHGWGLQLLLDNLPRYMRNVLGFSIQTNGFLTALPNLLMWFVGVLSSWYADWLIKNDKMSRVNVRKMYDTIAKMGPAVFILAASYAECNYAVAVLFFTLSMGTMGCTYTGVMVNQLDLSPNYSVILTAIMGLATSFSGSLVSWIIGILAPNQGLSEWRTVFWITFVILSVTTLIFNCLADGEVQYWNNLCPQIDEKKEFELIEGIPFLDDSVKTAVIPSKPTNQDCIRP